MEEYIELIEKINDILNIAETIDECSQKQLFLENNLPEFNNFKNSLHIILREYQFKEKDNEPQNKIVDKVKNNIIRLLDLKDVFKKDSQYEYFKYDLIEAVSWNENKFAFNLQNERDMNKVESALQYLQDREEYIKVLRDNNLFEGQSMNESAAQKYVSNEYEQNMFGHALIQIKNNFLTLPKEKIVKLIEYIDNSGFFKELISKDRNKMNFYENNLIYQYSETILKMKSIFTPDILEDDEIVKQMWNGNIEDSKTIKNILANISVKAIMDMSRYEQNKSVDGFIKELSTHFKNVNLSDKNTALIMKFIFESNSISYESAKFLAQIDIPNDYSEFIDSEYSKQFKWLTDFNIFNSLKKCEKSIEEAKEPFLPSEYYIKKLDKLYETSNISCHFVGNLITLIHSDYYSPEEKENLINALDSNGLYSNDLYSKNITDEQIIFEETDTPETINLKVKRAYYSGQIIPINIVQTLLNADLSQQNPIDKDVLQACVQGVICNTLRNNGIDIQNKIFFGDGKGINLGYNDPNNKAIWIDDFLLEKYLNSNNLLDKAKLFKTMFHEMQHSIQLDNIEKGGINYLTYNFIKEEIIEQYDKDFYNANYKSIFIESDARKEAIIGALEFWNELNPDFVKTIRNDMESEYIAESETHTLYTDSKKKILIGKNNLIDVSEYVCLLIQNNPKILTENPILAIEYNQNGTKKDIETLLQEFEQQKSENPTNYKDIYSIYYGLINKEKDNVSLENLELQQKIENFMQEGQELVTMEDMQNYYHSVDKSDMRQLYTRLYDITHNRQDKSISEEVDINDNNPR